MWMNREEGSVRQLGDQSELNSQKKETLKKEKKKAAAAAYT